MKGLVRIGRLFMCLLFAVLFFVSCIKKDLYKGDQDNGATGNETTPSTPKAERYQYPFGQESSGYDAEITIELLPDATIPDEIILSVPALKYNKSLLFMLTQDDCKHAAFSRTWAAINGKPITTMSDGRAYYYDIEQLEAGDLPPAIYSFGKALGSTDGFGNEVRFHFTTTISPEWDFMSAGVGVNPGYTANYYRFYMKSGLIWSDVREMLNYGTAIAFHDMKTDAVTDVDSLLKHFKTAQQITLDSLKGRGVKFLAEPNGNKTYLAAGELYPLISNISITLPLR